MAGSPRKRARKEGEPLPIISGNPAARPRDDIFNFDRYVTDSGTPFDPTQPLPDAIDFAVEEFTPRPDYHRHPEQWVTDRLGEFVWTKQVEIFHSIRDHRYTAVRSCHDAGKSFAAARAAARWLDLYEPGEAFVVTTAPTSAQVSAILWRELSRAHKKGGLAGRITSAGYPEWKIDGELVGYGRKPADYDESAFQGIHARYVLIVIDEAAGVSRHLFEAADALATNRNARVLAIGNPDDPNSYFATVCRPDSGWHVVSIDGLRTPNFNQEGVEWLDCEQCRRVGQPTLLSRLFAEEHIPYSDEHVPESLRDLLLSPLWVEERLHRWVGRPGSDQSLSAMAAQSGLFSSKVRGQFPTAESEGVVPLGWAIAAQRRWTDWVEAGRPGVAGRFVLGVDVAGQGDDETCLAFRTGSVVTDYRRSRRQDTMETVDRVAGVMTNSPPGAVTVVDSIGIGAGVVDRLRQLKVPTIAFTASGSAKGMRDKTGEFGFRNVRAAAWWRMRELLDPSRGSAVMIPDDEMLLSDLTAPHWKVMAGGVIQIESKEDIRQRLGRSTDAGDAVVQSFWVDGRPVDLSASRVYSWFDSDVDTDGVVPWGVPDGIEEPYGVGR